MVPPGPCALYPLLRDVCTRQGSRLSIRVRFAEGLSCQAASRLRRSHVSPPRTHTWRSCCSLSVAVMPMAWHSHTAAPPPLRHLCRLTRTEVLLLSRAMRLCFHEDGSFDVWQNGFGRSGWLVPAVIA